jgi:predicted outer membrane repeat protein
VKGETPRMRSLPKVLAALALLLLLHGQGESVVREVPAGGKHLARALAMAQPGDTLALAPGKHRAGGLVLPDGVRLIGQGESPRITGRGGQPLFRIEGAHTGVGLENLLLEGARSRESGGAIRSRESRVVLRGVTIRDCRSAQDGGALFAVGGRLEITDCRFHNNRATRGGAIDLERGDTAGETGRLVADNVLFANNRAERGGAISCEVPAAVTHGSFVGNRVGGAGDAHAAGAAIRAGDSLMLGSCNLVGNLGSTPEAGPIHCGHPERLAVSYTNLHGNEPADRAGVPVRFASHGGNQALDPRFVNPASGDFRLRWDSPLLDIGDPAAPLDFDLTRADIGWQPKFPVTILTDAVVHDVLPIGHYEASGNNIIHGEITPGTVIRLTPGARLNIVGAPSGNLRKVGDLTQPRTAIVGRSSGESEPGAKIFFLNNGNAQARLEFEGVLMNYPPLDTTYGASVFLNGWRPAQGNGITLDGSSIDFLNYLDVPRQGGDSYDGGLMFNQCTGYIDGIQFGDTLQSNPAYLALNSSRVDVLNCTFLPGQSDNTLDIPSLKIHGTHTGPEPRVHDNVFYGIDGRAPYMLDLSLSVVTVERNQFLGAYNTPLILTSCTTLAGNEARNHVESVPSGTIPAFPTGQPLVALEGGFLDLFCGRNNFLRAGASLVNPFIKWDTDSSNSSPVMTEWRENFWGLSCEEQVSDNVLNATGGTYLPLWSRAEDSLTECLDPTDPPNPLCPLETSTPAELLADGKLYEQHGDYANAHLYYQAVLLLYSSAKTSNEATLRLKALGLHSSYGPENYEAVRDHLFQAGDSSTVEGLGQQAMLQVCSGWCVEARWGNRIAAVAALNALFAVEKDKVNKDTITLALLEIATYPVPGQLSAAGPEAQMTLVIAQQEAVNTLLAYKRGQWADEEDTSVLPQTFQISNLYPNPFNARTTIVLQVPAEEKVRVEVYNLLGQLVGTLHEGVLPAGEHRLVADGTRWASGLYFVTAESAGRVQVRKMLLVK